MKKNLKISFLIRIIMYKRGKIKKYINIIIYVRNERIHIEEIIYESMKYFHLSLNNIIL